LRFLKAFGASILGLLLFFSLVVFSLAFMLNSTILSPSFVKKQVNRIDLSAVAKDIADQQIQEYRPAQLSFLEAAVYNAINDQEGLFKTQANQAIDSGYAFFLGKTNTLSINIPLSSLKTDLQASLWKEFGVQISQWVKGNNIQTQLEPYIFQNLSQYRSLLLSDVASLSDTQLKSYLDSFLKQVQTQVNTPAGSIVLSGLLQTLVKPYFDNYYNQYTAQIPDSLVVDQSHISSSAMDKLMLIRKYIVLFRSLYYWLIVLMIVLAAGIFLIYRNIQEPSRSLGVDLLVFGAFDLAGVLVARTINPAQMIINALPQNLPSLSSWLTALFHDVLMKALVFSIVVLAFGVALIVISFIFKKNTAEA
jgi:hypothetical protein